MAQTLRIAVFCVLVIATFGQASISPCKDDDEHCLLSVANNLYPKFMAGDPSIGAQVLDPVLVEEIDGSLTILKFKFTNTTVRGYKDCKITSIRIDTAQTIVKLTLLCPEIIMSGHYDINGRLIVLPIEGNGKYSLNAYAYKQDIEAAYKVIKDEGGKEHISIKNFKFEADPEKGTIFHFQNLFNGQKELSDAVHKFANENSREVAHEFQGPLLATTMKKFIKNINKLLKAMPMEHLFLQ